MVSEARIGDGQPFGDEGAESAGPPEGGEDGGDEELQWPRASRKGCRSKKLCSASCCGCGVGERGEVPDEMRAGAEELEGEGGVALLVEAVVVEDVGGAEEDGVAAAPGGEPDRGWGGRALG